MQKFRVVIPKNYKFHSAISNPEREIINEYAANNEVLEDYNSPPRFCVCGCGSRIIALYKSGYYKPVTIPLDLLVNLDERPIKNTRL